MKINKIFKFIGDNNLKYKNYKTIGEINENNKRHGYWYEYHSNGLLYSLGEYDNGLKEGEWEYYYDNGKIMEKGTYKNNKRKGIWNEYWSNGRTLTTYNYDK